MQPKLKILFLCTGNSCRSQMAEGWTRALKGELIEVYSAGVETHGLNPDRGRGHGRGRGRYLRPHARNISTNLRDISFDAVITVCDNARETCPFFPGAKKMLHVGFADPPAMARDLAAQGAGEEEQRDCYRRVRDEIRAYVETLPEALGLHPREQHTS